MNCKKCSKGDAGKEGTDSQDSAKWLCFHLRIRFRLVAQLFLKFSLTSVELKKYRRAVGKGKEEKTNACTHNNNAETAKANKAISL